MQAIDLSPEERKASSFTAALQAKLRTEVPTVEEDRYFEPDMECLFQKIRNGEILDLAETLAGPLAF